VVLAAVGIYSVPTATSSGMLRWAITRIISSSADTEAGNVFAASSTMIIPAAAKRKRACTELSSRGRGATHSARATSEQSGAPVRTLRRAAAAGLDGRRAVMVRVIPTAKSRRRRQGSRIYLGSGSRECALVRSAAVQAAAGAYKVPPM
jgi:hypothetical protein